MFQRCDKLWNSNSICSIRLFCPPTNCVTIFYFFSNPFSWPILVEMFLKLNFTSYHFPPSIKSGLKQCGGTRRFFFCFGHPSGTIFLGMPIRVCLHLSKIIFTSSVGWRDTAPPFTRPKTAKALVQKLQIWLLTKFFRYIQLFLQDGVSENSILCLNWSHKKSYFHEFMIWHIRYADICPIVLLHLFNPKIWQVFCNCVFEPWL